DPNRVEAMPGARAALDRLRRAGLRLGVVTNQSGLARGRFTADQLDAGNRRGEELVGPFDTWQICPHDDGAGRLCRKPWPVLLGGPRGRAAAELLPGVDEIVEWRLPWIDPAPGPVEPADMAALVERIRRTGADEAVIFTSFHQSALPLALVLRLAGIARITG